MLKVLSLFVVLVVAFGLVWVALAACVLVPLLGDSTTSALGTVLGLGVGALLMQWCLDYGQKKRWIKW